MSTNHVPTDEEAKPAVFHPARTCKSVSSPLVWMPPPMSGPIEPEKSAFVQESPYYRTPFPSGTSKRDSMS